MSIVDKRSLNGLERAPGIQGSLLIRLETRIKPDASGQKVDFRVAVAGLEESSLRYSSCLQLGISLSTANEVGIRRPCIVVRTVRS